MLRSWLSNLVCLRPPIKPFGHPLLNHIWTHWLDQFFVFYSPVWLAKGIRRFPHLLALWWRMQYGIPHCLLPHCHDRTCKWGEHGTTLHLPVPDLVRWTIPVCSYSTCSIQLDSFLWCVSVSINLHHIYINGWKRCVSMMVMEHRGNTCSLVCTCVCTCDH